MELSKHIKAHPWLFIGLSATPCCFLLLVQIYFFIFGKHTSTTPSAIPDWVWYTTLLCLPLLVGFIGFVLAYCLSALLERQRWLATRSLTRIYLMFFALLWNLSFGFLSFFVFTMGLGDGPPATSLEELLHRFIGILLFGIPEAILISIVVCSIATAIFVAVVESIAKTRKTG